MTEAQMFICGNPRDHACDSEGPSVVGGENEDGTGWTVPEVDSTAEQRRRATWGSVTCSVCGRTAMETSMWNDF